ncbi:MULTISPECIES: MFS transporter [unclassified Gordonia (in: high G+C Gram-positive bacteria)]|uniref:MFS transporter n=1 Tax=unclassified Gordonia (in: high G+C Gram-positive bacteria) TaxID=2657482 RepID=UPI00099146EF|nr:MULTISPECIES: MFS transporter [unclassified Gordonia (in: high G+C Gram-positive bacteria)]MCX2754231.1 MFS transporter [Gordonia sp. 4N]
MDIKQKIDTSPMQPIQFAVIAVCVLLNMLDGFDVLALAFSASHISDEWSLSGSQLGLLLSAALLGMAIGSMVVSQIADIIGRRRTIIICALMVSAGMALSAVSTGFTFLLVVRVLTGLAIGTLQACLNVMVAEYASAKHRSTAISFYTAGQPIGGTVGGIIAGVLLAQFDWRAVFVFGAVATFVVALLAIAVLPESLDYLVSRRPKDALTRINEIMAKLRQPALEAMPEMSDVPNTAKTRWKGIVSGPSLVTTVLLGFAFFVLMAAFYFANSWTPKLLVDSGFTAADGVQAGVLFSAGGIAGALIFGPVAMRLGVRRAVTILFALAGGAFVLYALSVDALTTAYIAAALLGLLTSAVMAGMFTIGPMYYEPEVRATAVGLIIGIGRVGAIISPIVAGWLLDADWAPGTLYYLFALPLLAGAAAIFAMRSRRPVLAENAGLSDRKATDSQRVSR